MTIVSLALGFIVHGALLASDYSALTALFRTPADSQNYMPFMMLAHLLQSFAYTWVYRQGISTREPALAQGIRFGIAMGFITAVPIYLYYYAVQPMPGGLIVKQIIYEFIAVIVKGVAIALLNRPAR